MTLIKIGKAVINPDRVAYLSPCGLTRTYVWFSAFEKDYVAVDGTVDEVSNKLTGTTFTP